MKDSQKDTAITAFSSVMLDPAMTNTPVPVTDIADVIIVHSDGTEQALGLGGYVDVGLHDTMEDLFVNFVGAVVFSTVGFFYVKSRGKGRFARRFIPEVVEDPPEEGGAAPAETEE